VAENKCYLFTYPARLCSPYGKIRRSSYCQAVRRRRLVVPMSRSQVKCFKETSHNASLKKKRPHLSLPRGRPIAWEKGMGEEITSSALQGQGRCSRQSRYGSFVQIFFCWRLVSPLLNESSYYFCNVTLLHKMFTTNVYMTSWIDIISQNHFWIMKLDT